MAVRPILKTGSRLMPIGNWVLDSTMSTISETTLTSAGVLTGLSLPMVANSVYAIDLTLGFNLTGIASTFSFGMDYTGTTSNVFAALSLGTGISTVMSGMSYSTPLNALLPGVYVLRVTGRIRTTTAGTLSFRAARSLGTIAVLGGVVTVEKVA